MKTVNNHIKIDLLFSLYNALLHTMRYIQCKVCKVHDIRNSCLNTMGIKLFMQRTCWAMKSLWLCFRGSKISWDHIFLNEMFLFWMSISQGELCWLCLGFHQGHNKPEVFKKVNKILREQKHKKKLIKILKRKDFYCICFFYSFKNFLSFSILRMILIPK